MHLIILLANTAFGFPVTRLRGGGKGAAATLSPPQITSGLALLADFFFFSPTLIFFGKGNKGCSQATLTRLKTLKRLFQMEFITIKGASRKENKFSCFKV